MWIQCTGTAAGHYYRGCSPVIHSGKVDKCDVTLERERSWALERCLCNSHLCNCVTSLRYYWQQHLATAGVTIALLASDMTWTVCNSNACGPDGPEIALTLSIDHWMHPILYQNMHKIRVSHMAPIYVTEWRLERPRRPKLSIIGSSGFWGYWQRAMSSKPQPPTHFLHLRHFRWHLVAPQKWGSV